MVKIDTKEKFHVLTITHLDLPANIAAELSQLVTKILQQQITNVVLKLNNVKSIEEDACHHLAALQQRFYEANSSLVICNLQPEVEEKLEQLDLLDVMNITRTESEAWDIVQMEEIERELLEDEDVGFPSHGE
jgi:anti-anti-sigma factor